MIDRDSFGGIGEEIFRQWLLKQGYCLIPTTLIENGGAPLLESEVEQFILPDFCAFKGTMRAWVDVKTKGRTAFNNKRQCHTTGCALRHFNAYKMVAEMTGIPGALAFIHADTPRLYFGMLDWLEGNSHEFRTTPEWLKAHPGHAFKEHMIFFDLARFDEYKLSGDGLFQKLKDACIPPQTVRAWEQKRKPPEVKQRFLF